MLRRVLLSTCVLALLAAPAAEAKPPGRALLSSCVRALEEADRAAVFVGQMRRVAQASRMQMRFTLQVRTRETRKWTAVSAPGFGSWVSSGSGTARYTYTKRVENLLAPASYRVLVRFRWVDASGRVVRTSKSRSPACRQPDPRPNLSVRSIGVQPADGPARRRYVVFVRNNGGSAADATELRVTVDGLPLPLAPVASLEPGEGVLVAVDGPACRPGASLAAEADAQDVVEERDEADNELMRSC